MGKCVQIRNNENSFLFYEEQLKCTVKLFYKYSHGLIISSIVSSAALVNYGIRITLQIVSLDCFLFVCLLFIIIFIVKIQVFYYISRVLCFTIFQLFLFQSFHFPLFSFISRWFFCFTCNSFKNIQQCHRGQSIEMMLVVLHFDSYKIVVAESLRTR